MLSRRVTDSTEDGVAHINWTELCVSSLWKIYFCNICSFIRELTTSEWHSLNPETSPLRRSVWLPSNQATLQQLRQADRRMEIVTAFCLFSTTVTRITNQLRMGKCWLQMWALQTLIQGNIFGYETIFYSVSNITYTHTPNILILAGSSAWVVLKHNYPLSTKCTTMTPFPWLRFVSSIMIHSYSWNALKYPVIDQQARAKNNWVYRILSTNNHLFCIIKACPLGSYNWFQLSYPGQQAFDIWYF